MASKRVKFSELKVSELKKELAERDLDTSGVKIVLQQRLRQALIEAGEDPDVFLFEIDGGISDFAKMLKEELSTTSITLKEELIENSRTLEHKLEESSRTLEVQITK